MFTILFLVLYFVFLLKMKQSIHRPMNMIQNITEVTPANEMDDIIIDTHLFMDLYDIPIRA
jgi:hypothetical protein